MVSKELKYKKNYQDNYAKIIRLCMGYTAGNESLAKDLTQETFIKVWQNLDSFRNESGMNTWIYRICVNTCLAEIRKKRKKPKNVPYDTIQVSDSTATGSEREDMLLQLYACIDKLSGTNKAIILLELEGLPQIEISRIIGIKHEAIRTRIHRIKNQLIKCANNE
jgi:RNA polymerase sigma factor (sigma-70 family)